MFLKKEGCGVKPCQVIRRGDKMINRCPKEVLHVFTEHLLLGELQLQGGSWPGEPGRVAGFTPAHTSEDQGLWKSFSTVHKGVITA